MVQLASRWLRTGSDRIGSGKAVQFCLVFQYLEHVVIIERPGGATGAVIARILERLTDLGVRSDWREATVLDDRIASGTLTIGTGTARHEFPAVVSPTVSSADLGLLPHDAQTILLTSDVSPARAQSLAERGWGGYVDSAGNASLRAVGLLIEVSGKRSDGAVGATTTAAPFTRAGVPVTFALLVANGSGQQLRQRDLAEWSGASIGTVNRVVRALRARTPPHLDKSTQLLRPTALEDEWVSAYSAMQPHIWPEERFTSDIWRAPSDVLRAELPHGALLGSELSAAQLGAPIRPSTALIHLPERARREFIRQGRLRRADDGMVRIRPAFWETLPSEKGGLAPRPLLRADLLLEDDPRIDEIQAQLFGDSR